jgi:hypothetical protein
VELPAITTLVADMRSEYQINVLAPDLLPAAQPLTLAAAHFGDPHRIGGATPPTSNDH